MNSRTKTKADEVKQADILQQPIDHPIARAQPIPPTSEPPRESPFMRIVERAMDDDNFDADKLTQLLAAKANWDASEARKAYVHDMAALKASEPLRVTKDRKVVIKHKTGPGKTVYDHASIGNVVDIATGAMGRFGFYHKWETTQEQNKDGVTVLVRVKCRVFHRLGHFEEVELFGPPDMSGQKSVLQGIVSAQTFLQRYTLLAALGMATMDQPDSDGRNDDAGDADSEEKALIAAWVTALNESETLEVLQKHKAKFLLDYGNTMQNVPEEIRNAYTDRLHVISPA